MKLGARPQFHPWKVNAPHPVAHPSQQGQRPSAREGMQVLSHCHHWDLRSQAFSAADLRVQLKRLTPQEALLVTSKTPLPPEWDEGTLYPLLDGPSLFQRIYLPPGESDGSLQQRREEHADWLDQFAQLRAQATQGLACDEARQRLVHSIEQHMAWEETHLFPQLERFLGTNRVCRELGYEHLGVRRLLPQLEEILRNLHPQSSWSETERKRGWEKFSLDLVHLLEHHLEHEERGPYPIYERLARLS